MEKKYSILLVKLIVFCTILGSCQTPTNSFRIYKEGNDIKVVSATSSKTIFSSESASKAIQYAIDHIDNKGGRITLARGLYELDTPIGLQSNIHLSGQGRGTELRPVGTNKMALNINNTFNAKVSFLTVFGGANAGAESGIVVTNSERFALENVLVFGFSKYGVHVAKGSSDIDIYRCDFTDNDKASVYFENVQPKNAKNTIRQSIFYWGGRGVLCRNSKGLKVTGSMFHQINGIPLDIQCNDFMFSGNRIFLGESLDAGIKIMGRDFKINYNIVTWNRGDGVVIENSDSGQVRGNNITDHGAPPRDNIYKSGVIIRNSKNIEVSANAIWNWDDWTQGPMEYGVFEDDASENNTIEHNNIHFYRKEAVVSQGSNTTVKSNVVDKGKDDQRLLADFDVWRTYIKNFVKDELSLKFVGDVQGEDFVIRKNENTYSVFTSITSKKVFDSMNPSDAIQWAIDHSHVNGGSVTLEEGDYSLNKQIVLKKYVWLRGKGSKTKLKFNMVDSGKSAIKMTHATQALISDLEIINSDHTQAGLELEHTINAKVQDVTVEGFTKYGILFSVDRDVPPGTWMGKSASALILVDNCRVGKNSEINIYKSFNGGYLGNAVPSMISRNIIYGGGQGITCLGICDNIVGNIVFQTKKEAIVVNANSVLTTSNTTYQTGASAFLNYDGIVQTYHATYDRKDNNNNKECHVTNNTFVEQKGHGIEISEQWGPIVDNVIYNTGVDTESKYGIWLHEYTESYTITGNTIYNDSDITPMSYGIFEEPTAFKNLIADNRISSESQKALLSKGKETLVIDNSTIDYVAQQPIRTWKVDSDIDPEWSHEQLKKYIENKVRKDF